MFAARFFGARFFGPRYWGKVGSAEISVLGADVCLSHTAQTITVSITAQTAALTHTTTDCA